MPLDQDQLLVEEYKLTYGYGVSFSTMRGQVFGACVTAFGLLVAFAGNQEFYPALGASAVMLLIALAGTHIITALNRGALLLMLHCKATEARFQIVGFSTYFPTYLRHNFQNSGTYAYLMASRLLEAAAIGYGLVLVASKAESGNRTQVVIGIITVVGFVVLVLLNEVYLQIRHRPDIKKLEEGLNSARQESGGR